MSTLRFTLIALVASSLGACAGAPRPEARMAAAQGAIRGAEEIGADNVPEASLYLKLADEQRQQGLALARAGHNHRAEYMFARSEADAELALAVARAATAQAAAQEATQEVQELKQQGPEPQGADQPATDDEQEER